ncbi:MAG TPA: DUF1801 domain-containing protein [Candidatus Limnocylindrales bacterium]|jgi:hypothetical protein
MPSRSQIETIPPEVFLQAYAPPIASLAERLRSIVKAAAPDAIERVRPGWALIGYDLPLRRRGAFFAWIWPEVAHVHLGFPNGTQMEDPAGVLRGAGITKKARWFTYQPGDVIDAEIAAAMIDEAMRVAVIPRSVLG